MLRKSIPDDKVAAVRAPLTDAVGTASRACAATCADTSAMSCTEISVFNIRRFTIRVLWVMGFGCEKCGENTRNDSCM